MSNYPSRTDIVTAMRNPNVSFRVDQLKGGSIIQKGSRVIQYSGGYTTVFPFHTRENKKIAVRLWIADIGEAKKRSLEISKYLNNLNQKYFVSFDYLDNAILVNGQIHPTVIMDWVEGNTLKEYIQNNISSPNKIIQLADNFREMVAYFHQANIAHGDLQHGNILVKDNGDLQVIDYDSMYIQPLDGMPDIIKGLPGYQHPNRRENELLNKNLDYFSELVIYLALLIFAENPNLWNQYYQTEDLLFSKEDFNSPNSSSLITQQFHSSNSTIADLTTKMVEQLQINDINNLSPLEELLTDKLEVYKENISEKWDKQPNPPEKKKTEMPDKNNIINKF